MIDYSFIRFKNNLTDAMSLEQSPLNDIESIGQIQLFPNETYLQITNSPTNIVVGNYRVWYVDMCGNDIIEVTNNFFVNQFTDSAGVSQMSWEFLNTFERYSQIVAFKIVNQDNNDTWYSNPFLSTAQNGRYTSRFDYKSVGIKYGVDYNRADFFQSIRLTTYYNNLVNESERQEYHQISTDITISARNIRDFRERYICHQFNEFTLQRLELAITSDLLYVNGVRAFSSTPIEFEPREADSDYLEAEMILNKNPNQTFTASNQIFEGLTVTEYFPQGHYNTGSTFTRLQLTFNIDITLNTGGVRVFEGSTLIDSFNETQMIIQGNNRLVILLNGSPLASPADGTYHVNVDAGLVGALGLTNAAIDDQTTWTFTLSQGDYSSADYDSTDYFTN